MAWYLRNIENLPKAAKNDLYNEVCTCMSSLSRRDGSASQPTLNVKSIDLYNIVNGQVAPTHVNVQDALHIGSTQSEKFADLLPVAFHSQIERNAKIVQEMKKVVIVNGKAIFDIEAKFVRLLFVGQQLGVEVTDQYELSPKPLSLIDEFMCSRKGNKTVLVKCFTARFKMYMSRKKPQPVKKLPPTGSNLQTTEYCAFECKNRSEKVF